MVTAEVGGAPGLSFDAFAPEEATTLYLSPTGDCSVKFDIAEAFRFWVVEVDATPVTFVVYAPAADFATHLDELQPIIDSVQWKVSEIEVDG